MDMDTFFVSVERLFDPSLVGKPVVVGGDPNKRGVVAAASYEVRRYGVHSAMPLSEAKRRCPHAVFVSGRHGRYSEYSQKVMEVIRKYSPLVEQVSVDEAYIDFTGCERLFGPVLKAASQMQREIYERLKLPASFGIGSNKLIAKVASANFAKPCGIFAVPEGSERDFLKFLPVGKLPGVGKSSLKRLNELGIFRIGDLAQFDEQLIKDIFGKYGEYLYRCSQGIHKREVEAFAREPKSVGRERTFQHDSLDVNFLSSTLFHLAERVGRELREEGLVARTITLKMRYSDFKTITRSQTLAEPTSRDDVIYDTARAQMLNNMNRRVRVRLLGIQTSKLSQADYQLNLLSRQRDEKYRSFYSTLDMIRQKFGRQSIFKQLVAGDE